MKTPVLKPHSPLGWTVRRTEDGPVIGRVRQAYDHVGRSHYEAWQGRRALTLYGRFRDRGDAARHVLMIDFIGDPDADLEMRATFRLNAIIHAEQGTIAEGPFSADILDGIPADELDGMIREFEHRPDPWD